MSRYTEVRESLRWRPRTWLVTGVAGFIGSNLMDHLLRLDQMVIGLDNFSTGHRRNLTDVLNGLDEPARLRFRFVEGDIRDPATCRDVCRGADYVLHQAALGSVPRSLDDPVATNASNVDGFVNMLVAARDAGVERFVYAASSSTYGDHPGLPKVENEIGRPLSPYAVTKYANELYADVFQRAYGLSSVGLRYFNVFGPRQDPDGAYAAVIPKWVGSLLAGEPCAINGDGETSRDFCYVANAVQANLLAAVTDGEDEHQVYNVACGDRTSLNDLFRMIRDELARSLPAVADAVPIYRDFRPGDVRHSQADIDKIRRHLGYEPTHRVADGLATAIPWYVEALDSSLRRASPAAERTAGRL